MEQQPGYILLIDCPDQKGLVHQISGVLYRLGLNIIGNQEFVEHEEDRLKHQASKNEAFAYTKGLRLNRL